MITAHQTTTVLVSTLIFYTKKCLTFIIRNITQKN